MDERMQERIHDVQYNQKLNGLDPQVRKIYQYVVDKEVELSQAHGLIRPNHKTPFEYATIEFGMTTGRVKQIIEQANETLY
uniref:hypothetical protein n=1 Tax=uncultured Allobacillus sp. TaxID=1638025 RepID=UPI002597F8E3|nr:hypothetical protein [uncultured Allobacillus sp.]